MVHITEVQCDLCSKVVTRDKITNSLFGSGDQSKYRLSIYSPKTERKLDLCWSCYQKTIKKIGWKKTSDNSG